MDPWLFSQNLESTRLRLKPNFQKHCPEFLFFAFTISQIIGWLEPPPGFEPETYALRVRCAAPELRRRGY